MDRALDRAFDKELWKKVRVYYDMWSGRPPKELKVAILVVIKSLEKEIRPLRIPELHIVEMEEEALLLRKENARLKEENRRLRQR